MNRDYKFRGLTKEGKEVKGSWIEYNKDHELSFIAHPVDGKNAYEWEDVLTRTVGMCTGLKDKNGKEIWGNVFVKDENGKISQVIWNENEAAWWLKEFDVPLGSLIFQSVQRYDAKTGLPYWTELEVIGNVFQNPEMLEAKP
jgi:hypothetical protein